MKQLLWSAVFATGLIHAPLLAQDATAASTEVECQTNQSASEQIQEALRAFNRTPLGQALRARNARGEIVLLQSDPTLVGANTNSADFGKSRDLAYAKAMLEAQAKFIETRSRTIESETASQFFESQPSSAQLTPPQSEQSDQVTRIGEKVFALTEAKLDRALAAEGVPLEEIERLPMSKKVQTYKDSLRRSSVTKAFGEVAGIIPVQNYEATDCNNLAAVGVVAVFSAKTKDFVSDVVNRKPILADPDRAGESLFAQADAEISAGDILYIHGLRKVHDESGYPSILSYGQWSYVKGGLTPRQIENKRRAALLQSKSNAEGQIAQFLSGQGRSVSETITEEISEEFIKVSEQGDQTTGALNEIVETQLREWSARGQVQLNGLRELATWTQPYPGLPDVMIAGTVVAWSPQFADAIGRATGGRTGQAASSIPEETDAPNLGSGVSGSKVKNNAADF